MKTLPIFLLLGMLAFGQAQVTDVPAVHVPVKSVYGFEACGQDACFSCSDNGHQVGKAEPFDRDVKCAGGWRWGCADKSAILLTAEDGTRHCLKIGPVEEPAKTK